MVDENSTFPLLIDTQEQSPPTCRHVHTAKDQCQFVRQHCADKDDGLISYLGLYYCSLAHAQVAVWFIIIPWLVLLFTTISISAGDFFAVNLSSIARALDLSDTLAGVTFLALGNGGPDIFSTWAAMSSGSAELAIGELIGAASVILAVVAGSMALVTSFRVREKSLVRDAAFLFATACLMLAIVLTQELHLWEGIVMIAIYALYVTVVAGYHWWTARTSAASHSGASENGVTGPAESETQPLLARQPQQAHGAVIRPPHQYDLDGEASKVVYHQIGDWRRAHHVCIGARNDYIVQPSLVGSFESRWRRGRVSHNHPDHQHSHVADQRLAHSSEQHTSALPPPYDSRLKSARRRVFSNLVPSLLELPKRHTWHATFNVVTSVPYFLLRITVPVVDDEPSEHNHKEKSDCGCWDRWLLLLQGFAAPQFVWVMLWLDAFNDGTAESWLYPALACLAGSVVFALIMLATSSSDVQPRWYRAMSIAGFLMSAFWLSIIADEVVSILKAIGVISGLSDAVLGSTVFAVGNSLDDLIADITVAQHGHPVMALSACFGGPLLNILLGLGASTIYLTTRQAQKTGHLAPIRIEGDTTLIISTAFLMGTLSVLVFVLRVRHWQMTRVIGICMICAWAAMTAANTTVDLLN